MPFFVLIKTTKTSNKVVNFWDEFRYREVRILSIGPKRGLLKGTGHLGKLRVEEKVTRKRTLHEYILSMGARSDCLWGYVDEFFW